MVIEISPDTPAAFEIDFNSPVAAISQNLSIIDELVANKDQSPLEAIAMEDRFELLFRTYGGSEYGFKQLAADVLTRNAAQSRDHTHSPLIDGRAAAAIKNLQLERQKIINQLGVVASNLRKLISFEASLSTER